MRLLHIHVTVPEQSEYTVLGQELRLVGEVMQQLVIKIFLTDLQSRSI